MNTILLSSPQLFIRLLKKTDLNEMHILSSNPEVERYNTVGVSQNISFTKTILKDRIKDNKAVPFQNATFAIEDKESGRFIGMFGIAMGRSKKRSAEIWYKFHPLFWGKGFATEAVNSVLDYCFDELKLHRVEAGCAIENIGSMRVLEKVGMFREGVARKSLPLESGWSDGYLFAILNTDERNQNKDLASVNI